MKNRLTILILLVCLSGLAQQKPNIVFILADDLGYSDPGYMGSKIKTPNLDKLRDQGMLMERCYVQPQCSPTRTAFLTGCYPYRFGLQEHIISDTNNGIPAAVKTVAEKMQEGGYETSVIGKWHLGERLRSFWPPSQGFDHSFIMSTANYWDYNVYKDGELYNRGLLKDKEGKRNRYSTYVWAEEATNVIKNRNKKKPLFMYLAFSAPHHPLQAPQELIDIYDKMEINDYWANTDELGRTREDRMLYMAMVDALDRAVGTVLETLEKEKMLDNTIIVFQSDNGPTPCGDARPLRSYKGDSYDGGVRTSAVAWWPGKVAKGSSSKELVYVGDWYPTFAEIAGMDWKNEDIDGVSALNVLKGGRSQRHAIPIISAARHVYVTDDYNLVGQGGDYYSILQDNFSRFQLFEINDDISQLNPIYSKPMVTSELKAAFRPWFEKVNRGKFNWDCRFTYKYRAGSKSPINDEPEIIIQNSAVTVSPVSAELVYTLKGTKDGNNWTILDDFFCREDAKSYSFKAQPAYKDFKLDINFHNGWPIRESFALDKYKPGVMFERNAYHEEELFPVIDGFLPLADALGAKNISILESSLEYKNWPREGGAIHMQKNTNASTQTTVSRYFYEPVNSGKAYVSMLVRFSTINTECAANINWLRQNDTETTMVTSLSLSRDGIFLKELGNGNRFPETRLGDYKQGEVVCILYEFNLGTTGNDDMKVYINPKKDNLKADAYLTGEFTFDRLQLQLNGREGADMTVDEIRVSKKLEDVLF